MNEFKIMRVLKDPTSNCCSLLFTCKHRFPVHQDDDLVVQHTLQNTKLFWPDMMPGIELEDVSFEDTERYKCEPINLQTFKFGWMLEQID